MAAALWLVAAPAVNGIAIIVDDTIITTAQIKRVAAQKGISAKEAAEFLISKTIEESESKKLGVRVEEFEVDQAIMEVANRNNLTIMGLRDVIVQKGMEWESYRQSIKDELLRDRLAKKVSAQAIGSIDEREMKRYYETHIQEFSAPRIIDVIQYSSKDRTLLEALIRNPLMNVPAEVVKEPLELDGTTLAPKLLYLINQTQEGSFTPIFDVKEDFLTLFVREKREFEPQPFESVKNIIFQKMAAERESEVLKDYFQKRRATAKINYLRNVE